MIEKSSQHYDSVEAYKAQKKYCDENNLPLFVNKHCPLCGKDVFGMYRKSNDEYRYGFSVEVASSTLITGCPFCNYSFCE